MIPVITISFEIAPPGAAVTVSVLKNGPSRETWSGLQELIALQHMETICFAGEDSEFGRNDGPQLGSNELLDTSFYDFLGNRATWGGGNCFSFEKWTFPRTFVWVARSRRRLAHCEVETGNGGHYVLLERIQNSTGMMGPKWGERN